MGAQTTNGKTNRVFRTMESIHQTSFEAIGGQFAPREHESTCAIRLAPTLFFKDKPPQHQRFEDPRIPSHTTYAYKQGATIARNDDFYILPEGAVKQIDILFFTANAPVGTVSLPNDGSEPYIGLAQSTELA